MDIFVFGLSVWTIQTNMGVSGDNSAEIIYNPLFLLIIKSYLVKAKVIGIRKQSFHEKLSQAKNLDAYLLYLISFFLKMLKFKIISAWKLVGWTEAGVSQRGGRRNCRKCGKATGPIFHSGTCNPFMITIFLVFIKIRWIRTGSHPYEKTMSNIVL